MLYFVGTVQFLLNNNNNNEYNCCLNHLNYTKENLNMILHFYLFQFKNSDILKGKKRFYFKINKCITIQ